MFGKVLSAVLVSGFLTQAQAAEPYVFKTNEPQQLSILNSGSLSLQKRLDMIASAKRSIEVEFFIYNIDQAGRLFTQALVKKAREGVRVRVLVDYGWPVAKLDRFYATVLMKNGVEVRYYNPHISFELFKGQFRSHRKALIIDDIEAMTGGRNIADEYFDLSTDYNFIDRDIHVRGSVAAAMRASFDRFWFSEMTQVADVAVAPKHSPYIETQQQAHVEESRRRFQAEMARAQDYLATNENDRAVLKSVRAMAIADRKSVQPRVCRDTTFAADMPGIGDDRRVLFNEIQNQLRQVNHSVHIESPYFVTTKNGIQILLGYLKKNIGITVYTNSLHSTDAIYTTATFYPRVGELIDAGMNVFIYKGQSLQNQSYISPEVKNARWGIHAKSAVLDEKTIIVGTFNVDPRSRNINAEMAIICRDNPTLAADVLNSMKAHEQHSVQLNTNGDPVDGTSAFENVSLPKRILYYLSGPISNSLDFLL
jgi:putative cardiolipin synthase